MTSTSTQRRQAWQDQAPFSGLSSAGRSKLESAVQVLEFAEGQAMSSEGAIGAQILVLLEGEARLLGRRSGRPFTLQKLGVGEIVGLASLLRAGACEQVNAATAVRAAAIPDALVLELLEKEETFRTWCTSHLWLAELHALLVCLEDQNAMAEAFEPERWRQRVFQLAEQARLLAPDRQIWQGLKAGEALLLGSANVPGMAIGSPFRQGASLPPPPPPPPPGPVAPAPPAPAPDRPARDRGSQSQRSGVG
jgi:ATP-binding cassette subfamily B protein